MAQATVNIEMDKNLKNQFDSLCAEFGMDSSVAFNIFAKKVVRDKKIPFAISALSEEDKLDNDADFQKVMIAFCNLRKSAKVAGASDMSLDEINNEIKLARKGA